MSQDEDHLPLDEIAKKQAPAGMIENANKLIGTAQNLVALFLGVTAILSGAGFVIVNVHLSKFTDIHGLNVSSNQYILAGLGFLGFGLVNILVYACLIYIQDVISKINKYKPQKRHQTLTKRGSQLILLIVCFILLYGFTRILNLQSDRFVILESVSLIVVYVFIGRRKLAKSVSVSMNFLIWIFVLSTYIVIGGYTYSESIYQAIPSYLVGGQPKVASFVFKDEAELKSFGIAQDSTQTTHTQNIMILADLRDGFLILDPTSGHVVSIKDESILGIYDDKVNTQYLVTATPTFTPSPTSTQLASVTPSPAYTPTP